MFNRPKNCFNPTVFQLHRTPPISALYPERFHSCDLCSLDGMAEGQAFPSATLSPRYWIPSAIGWLFLLFNF